jgi:hypothetical protein|tara:strand:- start:684 stop:1124 length:441 start_codon:yes stop_codon:yes gene_type:complete
MSDYDDTDRGVLWKPRTDQVLRAIGKINNKGVEKNALLMACQSKDGEKYYELYQKVAPIYIKEADANPNAPDFSGPLGEDRRIAFWVNEFPQGHAQEGTKYLKANITDKMTSDTANITTKPNETADDKIQEIKDSFKNPDQWDDQF